MINEFMEYLKELEPLPEGIELDIVLVNKKSLGVGEIGSEVLALFETRKGATKATLTIATKGRSKQSTLCGLAHEYYHAVQWFRDGLCVGLSDGLAEFIEYESDAEGFGYRVSLGWVG
jgi:hypothetical protein